jgi:tetratricopeptide (TPR) repeat protein
MTGAAAKPAADARPASAGPGRDASHDSWVRTLGPSLIAAGLVMALLNIANPPYAYQNLWRGVMQNLLSTLAGLFPYLLYSFFIGARRLILKRDFELNLQRLGLNSADESFVERFNAVFGAEDRLSQFARAPLILLTVLLLIGWFLVYYPRVPDDTPLLWPNFNPLSLGFLGAYFITLMVLYQRYVTNDLKPPLFVAIAVRVLMVLILDMVLGLAAGRQLGAAGSPDSTTWPVLVAAFVIGIFPAAGVRLLTQTASRVIALAKYESFDEPLPLSRLDGMNILSELRLYDEGINNLENMATADIVELFLQTRFPAERIIDWVDQALLQIHVVDENVGEAYRRLGVRTASDLADNYQRARQEQTFDELRARLGGADPGMATPGALELIITALDRDPNMYQVRYWREHEFEVLPRDANQVILPGVVALLRDQPREAIRLYEEARRNQERYPPLAFYLGLAYTTAERYDQAIKSFTEAIGLNEPPGQPRRDSYPYYVARGRAYLDLVISHARNNHTGAPGMAGAIQNLTDAISDFRVAEQLQPLANETQLLLGEALALQIEQREEAVAVLQHAIDLDPGRVSPLTNEAYILYAQVQAGFLNRYEDAARLLQEPVNERRAGHELLLLLGYLRFGLRDWDRAEQAYRYAEALAGEQDPRPALGVVRVLARRGALAAALAALQTLTTRWPDSGPAFLQLGQALLARAEAQPDPAGKDLQDAHAALQRAAQLAPSDPLIAVELGRALIGLNREDEARAQFQRAIDLAPAAPPGGALTMPEEIFGLAGAYAAGLNARYRLGLRLEVAKDWTTAQELFREATQLPEPAQGLTPLELDEWRAISARVFLGLGRTIYEHQADDATAERAFEAALARDPKLIEALESQGLAILAQARAVLAPSQGGTDSIPQYTRLRDFTMRDVAAQSNLPLLRMLRGIALLEISCARANAPAAAGDGAERRAELNAAQAELEAALDGLEQAGRLNWVAVTRFYLGRVQFETNQKALAIESFRGSELMVNFTRSPVALYETYYWLARTLRDTGDADGARETAVQARLFAADAPQSMRQAIDDLIPPAPGP